MPSLLSRLNLTLREQCQTEWLFVEFAERREERQQTFLSRCLQAGLRSTLRWAANSTREHV